MPLFGSENWLYIAFIGLVVGLLARLLKPGRDRMGLILTPPCSASAVRCWRARSASTSAGTRRDNRPGSWAR